MAYGADGGAGMKIAVMVEGKTEKAFMPYLREFLRARLATSMPNLDAVPYDGRIPKAEKLKRCVENLLTCGKRPADAVIALTDVYTGSNDFLNALAAKEKMQAWVGKQPKFYPHVAHHDFEAWLLPYWSDIQRLAGTNRTQPSGNPENVNRQKPPSRLLNEVFLNGSKGKGYVKERDAARILRSKDLLVSINACAELKSFVNTILVLCGSPPIP
jgi:hypothetical protein